jgi:hypothetical protein
MWHNSCKWISFQFMSNISSYKYSVGSYYSCSISISNPLAVSPFKYCSLMYCFLKIISPNLVKTRWSGIQVYTFFFVSKFTYQLAPSNEPPMTIPMYGLTLATITNSSSLSYRKLHVKIWTSWLLECSGPIDATKSFRNH